MTHVRGHPRFEEAEEAVVRGDAVKRSDVAGNAAARAPLIINDANSPLPALDSTRSLARAALRRAVH